MPRRTSACLATAAFAVFAAVLPPGAEAAPTPATTPFRVGFIGDTGYDEQGEANLLEVRESANAAGLAFVVHDGDIWMGGTACSDDRLRRVKAVLEGFRTLVYTPGDNEWQDCPRPDGRLPAIRQVFFSTSLGTQPIAQYRQPGVPENARWERGGVVFATPERARSVRRRADRHRRSRLARRHVRPGRGRPRFRSRWCWSTATPTGSSSTTPGRTSPTSRGWRPSPPSHRSG